VTFYNTNKEAGATLRSSRRKAAKQENLVRDWFQANQIAATPSDVWRRVFDCKVPLTSVRRCMSDLTKQEVLRKTDLTAKGVYGKPEHFWVYAEQQDLFA